MGEVYRITIDVITHKPRNKVFAKASYLPAKHMSNKHKKMKTDNGKEGLVQKSPLSIYVAMDAEVALCSILAMPPEAPIVCPSPW